MQDGRVLSGGSIAAKLAGSAASGHASALAPDVQELRLRVGCAPAFTMRGAVCTPQETARELASLQRMLLTPQQMEEILFTLCGGSVHTHQTEIAQGYVTGPSGCRAGLSGRFLQTRNRASFCRN